MSRSMSHAGALIFGALAGAAAVALSQPSADAYTDALRYAMSTCEQAYPNDAVSEDACIDRLHSFLLDRQDQLRRTAERLHD